MIVQFDEYSEVIEPPAFDVEVFAPEGYMDLKLAEGCRPWRLVYFHEQRSDLVCVIAIGDAFVEAVLLMARDNDRPLCIMGRFDHEKNTDSIQPAFASALNWAAGATMAIDSLWDWIAWPARGQA